MKHFNLILFLILHYTLLNAQIQVKVENLPAGIKQYGFTIEGHDNLIMVDRFENYKQYFGIYDINGKEVISCKYLSLYSYKNGISVKDDKGNWGVLDYGGNVILEPKSLVSG